MLIVLEDLLLLVVTFDKACESRHKKAELRLACQSMIQIGKGEHRSCGEAGQGSRADPNSDKIIKRCSHGCPLVGPPNPTRIWQVYNHKKIKWNDAGKLPTPDLRGLRNGVSSGTHPRAQIHMMPARGLKALYVFMYFVPLRIQVHG